VRLRPRSASTAMEGTASAAVGSEDGRGEVEPTEDRGRRELQRCALCSPLRGSVGGASSQRRASLAL
jgi:hypothetical protein